MQFVQCFFFLFSLIAIVEKTILGNFQSFFVLIYFGCAGSFVAVRVFSGGGEQGLLSRCRARVSHPSGFPLVVEHGVLEVRCVLYSCGSQVRKRKLSICVAWS